MDTKCIKNVCDEFFRAFEDTGLDKNEITRLAYETGFCRRSTGKIKPHDYMLLMCKTAVKGSPSFNDLATRLQSSCDISVSRQALWKRTTGKCVAFFQRVLSSVISSKIANIEKEARNFQSSYKRVLVQDSTVIRLPLRLFGEFSGVKNSHSAVCNARVQSVYELLAGEFVSFSVDAYSKNDLTAAPELDLNKGDLALRDRGYLTYDEVQRHLDAGADCIYRHKFKNIYLDPGTGEQLDLLKGLKRDGRMDREVLLNNDARTKVRIVAAPVDEELANIRRMKAKKETRGHAPSAELLELMSWSIFITTVPATKASFKQILAIYGLRWRIENIFKTWKSNMNFSSIHNVSENQLRVLLSARLIVIVICNHWIFRPCFHKIRQEYEKELSMMKVMKYLSTNFEKIPEILLALRSKAGTGRGRKLFDALARYCTYDKRERPNFIQLLEQNIIKTALG